MSEQELKRVEVIALRRSGQINQAIPSLRPMPGCQAHRPPQRTLCRCSVRGPGRPCSLPDDRRRPATTDSVQALSTQAVEDPDLSIPLHPAASASEFGWAWLARRCGHRARALRSILRSALASHLLAVLNAAKTTRRATRTGPQRNHGQPAHTSADAKPQPNHPWKTTRIGKLSPSR